MKKISKKIITLIGPSGVGKSLIAKNLSKKENMPIICIDDIIQFIDLEQTGKISKKPETQKEYALKTFNEIKNDKEYSKNLETEEGINKTIELIGNIINDYNATLSTIGPLNRYYKILDDNDKLLDSCNLPIEHIVALNFLSINLITEIQKHIKKPFILDPPASFGWIVPEEIINSQSKFTRAEIKTLEQKMLKFLSSTSSILLEPGTDYELRNPSKQTHANNILLNNFNTYYESNPTFVIATNALFFEPNNNYLKQRSWLYAQEHLVKDKLKNKAEIENITDQIMFSLKGLEIVNEK